jgi:hypothetical protein
MTRLEAIEKMKEGAKVKHRYFDDHEWIKLDGDRLLFEDRSYCPQQDFWEDRTGGAWENDWDLFEEEEEKKWTNTINDPLIVTYQGEYKCSKPEDQSGSYVDLTLAKEVTEALQDILDIGKRDMSNPKYDGYFRTAEEVIKKIRG